MTVKELIEELKKYPADFPVKVFVDTGFDMAWVEVGTLFDGRDVGENCVKVCE